MVTLRRGGAAAGGVGGELIVTLPGSCCSEAALRRSDPAARPPGSGVIGKSVSTRQRRCQRDRSNHPIDAVNDGDGPRLPNRPGGKATGVVVKWARPTREIRPFSTSFQ